MEYIFLTIVAILLSGSVMLLGNSFGDSVFFPEKQNISKYQIKNNTIFFEGENLNGLSGKYSFNIPNKNIKPSDIVDVSYSMNNMQLVKIRTIFLNDVEVWNDKAESKINLKKEIQ